LHFRERSRPEASAVAVPETRPGLV
jgi:hypothetical protein